VRAPVKWILFTTKIWMLNVPTSVALANTTRNPILSFLCVMSTKFVVLIVFSSGKQCQVAEAIIEAALFTVVHVFISFKPAPQFGSHYNSPTGH